MTQPSSFFWFRERIRDIFLWPYNLIRDFPARSKRLFQTLNAGFTGLYHLPSEFQQAHKQQQSKTLFAHKTKCFLHGVHLLVVQIFDLFGGPEIAQFSMHLLTHTTPLTAQEKERIASILGSQGMRYEDVRIAEGGLWAWVFHVNGRLAFTTWYTINLPKPNKEPSDRHTRQNQSLLIHELVHVYQHEKVGTRYMTEAIYVLITTKRNCYQYGGVSGLEKAHQDQKQFIEFNREQQAQIVQDYFTRKQSQLSTDAYELYMQQLHDGRL